MLSGPRQVNGAAIRVDTFCVSHFDQRVRFGKSDNRCSGRRNPNQTITIRKDDIDEVFVFRSHRERVQAGLRMGGVADGRGRGVLTAANGASFGLIGADARGIQRIYLRDH